MIFSLCSALGLLKLFTTKAKPHCTIPSSMAPGACRMETALCPGWEKSHIPGLQALSAGHFWFSATCCHQSTSYDNLGGSPGHHDHVFLGLRPGNLPRALAPVQSVIRAVSSLCGHTVLLCRLLSLSLTHSPFRSLFLLQELSLLLISPGSYTRFWRAEVCCHRAALRPPSW